MEGERCTVIAWGAMVHVCERAIEESGISCDLIDLQSLVPWDRDAITNSVEKTGRCVIVHEAPKTSGFGAEMAASIQERCFYSLESPIERVTGWDTPFPSTEWDYMPDLLELRRRYIEHRRIEMGNFYSNYRYWKSCRRRGGAMACFCWR